ncbi:hypothetical protein BH24DEI2_BH24DEI2_03450 [soil metagenome]
MVANKIYTKTHEGLTDLVSARVASQVLDNGLRARRYSPETVTVGQMASVLKGPVMKELSGSLPRAGLERSLKKLLKTLKTLPSEKPKNAALDLEPDLEFEEAEVAEGTDAVVFSETVLNEAESNEAVSNEAVSYEDDSDEAGSDEAGSDAAALDEVPKADETQAAEVAHNEVAHNEVLQTEAAEVSAEPFAETPSVESHAEAAADEVAVQTELVPARHEHAERSAVALSASAPSAAQVLERTAVAPPVVRTPLEPAARDRTMLGFAELEHVKMVAAFENGTVSSVLGHGFEVAGLSRLGTLGLKLLGRSGELRTFYVAHAQGQLFLFPLGATTLMLIGSSELNLGLVFATLQKLKEEL